MSVHIRCEKAESFQYFPSHRGCKGSTLRFVCDLRSDLAARFISYSVLLLLQVKDLYSVSSTRLFVSTAFLKHLCKSRIDFSSLGFTLAFGLIRMSTPLLSYCYHYRMLL